MYPLLLVTVLSTLLVLVATTYKRGVSAASVKIVSCYLLAVLLFHFILYQTPPPMPARTSVTWEGRMEHFFSNRLPYAIDNFFREIEIIHSALVTIAIIGVWSVGVAGYALARRRRTLRRSSSPMIPIEADRALSLLRKGLGGSLTAAYLHGSAVDGGLHPHSDVDLLAVVDCPMTAELRGSLAAGLMRISGHYPSDPEGRRPLEVIVFLRTNLSAIRYPASCEFIYGEWLRDVYGAGEIPVPTGDPELTLILAQARKCAKTLLGPSASELLPAIPEDDIQRAIRDALPTLVESLPGDERNVLLTLARMWHTLATGDFVPKDAAALWAEPRLRAQEAAVLADARRSYLGQSEDNWSDRGPEVRRTAAWLRDYVTAAQSDNIREETCENPWVHGAPPPEHIEVVPYDPRWPEVFRGLERDIRTALGDTALAIEHVGSTAVPGLAAKPVIDIDLTVPYSTDEAAYVPQLEKLGYDLYVREPGWHEHRCFRLAEPRVNLHVFGPDCPETVRHAMFREWLKSHPVDRVLYGRIKLMSQHGVRDVVEYNARKQPMIREIYERMFRAQKDEA